MAGRGCPDAIAGSMARRLSTTTPTSPSAASTPSDPGPARRRPSPTEGGADVVRRADAGICRAGRPFAGATLARQSGPHPTLDAGGVRGRSRGSRARPIAGPRRGDRARRARPAAPRTPPAASDDSVPSSPSEPLPSRGARGPATAGRGSPWPGGGSHETVPGADRGIEPFVGTHRFGVPASEARPDPARAGPIRSVGGDTSGRILNVVGVGMRLLGQRPRYQEGPPEGAGFVRLPPSGAGTRERPPAGQPRGEGPLGADLVTRSRTRLADTPTPPARGCTAECAPRPGPPC